MRILKPTAALLCLAGFGLPAQAVPIQPDAGTVFVFSEGRVERFVRTEGDQQIWSTRRGREYARSANPAAPITSWSLRGASGTRDVFGKLDKIWPPRAGTSTRFRVLTKVTQDNRTRRSVQNWRCEVGDAQALTVGVGTYETLPISCMRYSIHSMRPLEKRTWWYSNEIGHYVKRRYESLRDGKTSEYRLCATLTKRRASSARIRSVMDEGC